MSPRASEPELTLLTVMTWAKVPLPEAEHQFHPERKWRFDFAWPAIKVAAEIEGGIWSGGAHTRGRHFESDAEKYNEAAIAGWLVIRVTPDMVEDGRALTFIERAIKARTGSN